MMPPRQHVPRIKGTPPLSTEPVTTSFNRSLCIGHRSDRLTGDPGAVVLREILDRSGIVEWLVPQLTDPRRQEDVVYDLASLIRTSVLLAAQGRRDHDEADALRDDPAYRLAVSSSAGQTPLLRERGLTSQPTLSRFTAIMATPANLKVLREAVPELGARGAWAERGANGWRGSRSTSTACPSRSTAISPRYVHFTPTSASWLNQVERWFAELTRKQIQRGVHRSVAELEADIAAFIDAHN